MEEDGSKRQISVNDVTILDDKTVILDSLTAQKGNLYNSRKWFWKNENTTYSKKLLMRRAHHFWCLALSASKQMRNNIASFEKTSSIEVKI